MDVFFPKKRKTSLRFDIYYSLSPFSVYEGNQSCEWFAFESEMTSLITNSLVCCRSAWGGFVFFPKAFAGFKDLVKPKKLHLHCTKVIPKKEVSVPINSRGAPLTPGCSSLHTLFILWPVQGHLSFAFCISKPEQRLRLLCTPTVPALRWSGPHCPGSCQGAPRACDHSEPCHCHCSSAAASPMLVVLPPLLFPHVSKGFNFIEV